MSPVGKKRVLFLLLVLFAVWPLVHHALVVRYEINPWKFFGWSMYCTPPNHISVGVFDVRGNRPRRLLLDLAPPAVRSELAFFRATRQEFGVLARPHLLADAIFRWNPVVQRIQIVVQNLRLDPKTDRFEARRSIYGYQREGTDLKPGP